MKLKNCKIKYLLINLVILLAYPAARAYASDNDLFVLSDTTLIFGLAAVVFGVINSFFLHGDLDITGFVASRTFSKKKPDFDVYMKDQEDKRKDSFNYPLLCGLILIVISIVAGLLA